MPSYLSEIVGDSHRDIAVVTVEADWRELEFSRIRQNSHDRVSGIWFGLHGVKTDSGSTSVVTDPALKLHFLRR